MEMRLGGMVMKDIKVDFHVIPNPDETFDELLARVEASHYTIKEIDRENNRILVERWE